MNPPGIWYGPPDTRVQVLPKQPSSIGDGCFGSSGPMNENRSLVALRQAAVNWANASREEPKDAKDSGFAKFDKALRRAALKYADAVRG